MGNLIIGYISKHKLYFLVGTYFCFSVVLKATTGIDVCIPCIWKTISGSTCPGCGLTAAAIDLLHLDIASAYRTNWLIFIIIPSCLFLLISSVKKYLSLLE